MSPSKFVLCQPYEKITSDRQLSRIGRHLNSGSLPGSTDYSGYSGMIFLKRFPKNFPVGLDQKFK
jgi:hypothetical protein